MPTDAEITFADHMGRFYARRFSFPPMVGRLIGYLAVCDPPNPTIGELAEALLASRSAIAGAVKVLETIHVVQRSRVAGERMDRVRIDLSSQQSMGMDVSEYEEMRELAREGLEVLGDAPPERRAALLEMSAFAEFLVEQIPKLGAGVGGAAPGARRVRRLARKAPWPREAPMTDTRQPAVVVTGVRKSFGETVVLDGVDLTVAEGTIFALLGPNGAGKTTMVRILSTLIRRRLRRRAGGRPRRRRRPGRRARVDRSHRPVLGGGRAADRRGEPAADGRPEPPRPRRRPGPRRGAARPVRPRGRRRAGRCRRTRAGCAAASTWP